jgi:hypothetical protein
VLLKDIERGKAFGGDFSLKVWTCKAKKLFALGLVCNAGRYLLDVLSCVNFRSITAVYLHLEKGRLFQ